ncbi:MAG: hypothetical protein EOP87_01050 [Verrucomicrobiaceae bacterium]|nr:MAG: hypothetical protein EOP87_01050 [Verrucomicrobiaceae bacterium]
MKTTLLLCAVGFASFAFSGKAMSQSLITTLVEISPNVPVNGSVDGSFFQNYPSGTLVFTDFQAFCVEPGQGLSYGQTLTFDLQNPGDLVNSVAISKLVGGFLASGGTALDAAAVQWAIWEVVAELSPTRSVTEGNVILSPSSPSNPDGDAVATLANQYLANIDTFAPASLYYLTHPDYQNVVTWTIPEPGSAALAALSALVLLRRRRR